MTADKTALPQITSQKEWETSLQALLAREKALTRMQDELAAERRRLPMVPWKRTTPSRDRKER